MQMQQSVTQTIGPECKRKAVLSLLHPLLSLRLSYLSISRGPSPSILCLSFESAPCYLIVLASSGVERPAGMSVRHAVASEGDWTDAEAEGAIAARYDSLPVSAHTRRRRGAVNNASIPAAPRPSLPAASSRSSAAARSRTPVLVAQRSRLRQTHAKKLQQRTSARDRGGRAFYRHLDATEADFEATFDGAMAWIGHGLGWVYAKMQIFLIDYMIPPALLTIRASPLSIATFYLAAAAILSWLLFRVFLPFGADGSVSNPRSTLAFPLVLIDGLGSSDLATAAPLNLLHELPFDPNDRHLITSLLDSAVSQLEDPSDAFCRMIHVTGNGSDTKHIHQFFATTRPLAREHYKQTARACEFVSRIGSGISDPFRGLLDLASAACNHSRSHRDWLVRMDPVLESLIAQMPETLYFAASISAKLELAGGPMQGPVGPISAMEHLFKGDASSQDGSALATYLIRGADRVLSSRASRLAFEAKCSEVDTLAVCHIDAQIFNQLSPAEKKQWSTEFVWAARRHRNWCTREGYLS